MSRGHDYALYTDVPNARVKLYAWLAVISVLLSTTLHDVGKRIAAFIDQSHRLDWLVSLITSFGAMTIFGVLIYLFRTFVWKWRIAAPLYALGGAKQPPIIAGKFLGTVSWFDSKTRDSKKMAGGSHVMATIIQSWDNILIRFDFPDGSGGYRAGSTSEMAILEMGLDPSRTSIQYTYRYDTTIDNPNGKGVTRTFIHGTSLMTFNMTKKGWRVDGHYYSDDGGSGKIALTQKV